MDDLQKEPTDNEKLQVTRIVLPFKCQRSANTVRRQTSELSSNISVQLSPAFTSRKLNDDLKSMEQKPALVNKPKVVYHFQCDQLQWSHCSGWLCRLYKPTLTPKSRRKPGQDRHRRAHADA